VSDQCNERRGDDAWEQGAWVWSALLYGVVAVTTVLALLDGEPSGGDRWVMLALAAAMVAWHFAFERIGMPEDTPRRALLYWAGLVAMWFFLAGIDPTWFALLLALYPQIFRLLRLRQALPGAVALTVVVVWREVLLSGRPLAENWSAIGGGVLSLLFGTLFTIWITRIIEQSADRRQLIEQLQSTRDELAAAERESGRLAERQRLARDLHDTLAQAFVSIVLQLQAAEGELPAGADAARAHLERARRTASDNLTEVRRLVWDLRPESLRASSLGEALGRLTDRLAEETGVAATAAVTGTPRPLSPDAEVTLLRVTQEALANVRKHARAGRVALTLSYMDGEAALDVRDDGVGFVGVDGSGPNGGLGLHGMRERVEALGGRLAVESAPGAGTTVAVTVPVPPEPEGAPA
jgi:signal transduction histidine kinase